MPTMSWKASDQPTGQLGVSREWSQDWIDAVNKMPIESIFKSLAGYRDEATERKRYDEWKAKHPTDPTSWERWVRAMAKGYYPGRQSSIGQLQTNVSVPDFTGDVFKTQTPNNYFGSGQGGYGTPPPGSTPAGQTGGQMTQQSTTSNFPFEAIFPGANNWYPSVNEAIAWYKKTYPEMSAEDINRTIEDYSKQLKDEQERRAYYATGAGDEWYQKYKASNPNPVDYDTWSRNWEKYSPDKLKDFEEKSRKYQETRQGVLPQTPIPTNWMDVVNKAVGQKYAGATQYSITPPITESTSAGIGTLPKGTTIPNVGDDLFRGSPAGNNITSGAVNPTTALSGNNLATTATAPGVGTSTFGTNTSFLNPASGTATQKRKTGANKYFNQQWFGGKQML